MSVELVWTLLPPMGWLLWALGGTYWKPYRRILWPLVLLVLSLAYGIIWWRAVLTAILVVLTCSLGYGDRTSWFARAAVGMSYGAALLPLHLSWLWWPPVVMGVWFTSQLALSRRWNAWTHKIVEGSTGLLQGAIAVWIMTH